MPDADQPHRLPPPRPGTTELNREQFLRKLKELVEWSGLALKQLGSPSSTSSEYLNGHRVPKAIWVHSVVSTCLQQGAKEHRLPDGFDVHAEVDYWLEVWAKARDNLAGSQPKPEEPQRAKQSEDSDQNERWGPLGPFMVAAGGYIA